MSIHSFVFLEMAEREGATAPPSHPPKFATAYINIEAVTILVGVADFLFKKVVVHKEQKNL